MLIKVKAAHEIPSSEITPESVYRARRAFLKGAGVAGAGLLAGPVLGQEASGTVASPNNSPEALNLASKPQWLVEQVAARQPVPDEGLFTTGEMLTPFQDVTTYNNFYEFGTDKSDPSRNARAFKVDPWTVEVTGAIGKPGTYTLEDILKPHALEERIYRLRCVEAWSMVIPWVGFPLGDLIKRFEPTSKAKFVEFITLIDKNQMPGQRSRLATIDWPYREGLRMDEAMHPLTLLAVGLYGDILPAQSGAPLRLVVPWKYGFKSIKSIVRINFRETMPNTTWSDLQPNEYGFYANVNPAVSHPRWSQATERRLPGSLFMPNRIGTLPFNGYAEAVADLYKGMDLRKLY
ncbi:MAG: protein-methionine-sulfoxide reductase catalytic subunit MsrP [Pseudomonadales bacterium]|jgi:sulfoxide reductase catalytic subunit YedY|nr:protein-methionine-sulfoxide reductase catalytic subunit MsrP [Pseudomonadales bacterium]